MYFIETSVIVKFNLTSGVNKTLSLNLTIFLSLNQKGYNMKHKPNYTVCKVSSFIRHFQCNTRLLKYKTKIKI